MLDDNSIVLFFDYLGIYAPIILFFISILLLQNKTKYLQIYTFGFIFNIILNSILKYAIKEPRPSKSSRILEIGIPNTHFGFDNYGMPSGHAQTCGYSLAFITLVLNNPLITGLYLVFTFISLFQRFKYNNHTILQLIVGLAVGLGFGYLMYHVGNKWIKGDLKMKLDDNAPK
jgi:membrane-associated phospholipid phosphatase